MHFPNIVFSAGYPLQWTISKIFTIFKKGSRALPGNHRGISVLVALHKLYDNILNKRLSWWFTPNLERAGAIPGRSCAEQLAALCLLIDTAQKLKQDLYIVIFIDYEKAYDYVDRNKLLSSIARKGCGRRFIIHLNLQSKWSIQPNSRLHPEYDKEVRLVALYSHCTSIIQSELLTNLDTMATCKTYIVYFW